MEYERALYRVYERVIDDLNRTPSPQSGRNVGGVTGQQQSEEYHFLPFCFPFFEIQCVNLLRRLYIECRAIHHRWLEVERGLFPSSYSPMNESLSFNAEAEVNTDVNNDDAETLSTETITRRFHQRAISRLHSMTGGDSRQGSRARYRGRAEDHQNGRSTHSNEINVQSGNDNDDRLELNDNESSPLRRPNNFSGHSSDSDGSSNQHEENIISEAQLNRRTISFGSHINTNPFSARPATNFDDMEPAPGCSQLWLYKLMNLVFFIGLGHLIILWILHTTYVRPDSIGGIFGRYPFTSGQKPAFFYTLRPPNASQPASIKSPVDVFLTDDQIDKANSSAMSVRNVTESNNLVQFYHGPTCLEYALSTRPIRFYYNITTTNTNSSSTANISGVAIINNASAQSNSSQKLPEGKWTALPLLLKSELLYINVLYGEKFPSTEQCSKAHIVTHSSTFDNNEKNISKSFLSSDCWSNAKYWEKPTYKFSSLEALLYVDDEFLWNHNISIVNITVTERCLSSGVDNVIANYFTKLAETLSQVYGIDAAIINQLMYGVRNVDGSYRDGFLLNMETEERWSWRREFMEYAEPRSSEDPISGWFGMKIGVLFLSLLSFFLITSISALIVRILTSSGVVLMFPIFAWLRLLGVPGADDRILSLSYPWIGRARNVARLRNIYPESHLIFAHLAKIALFYVMYEASQAAWSVVLYGKSLPDGLPVWVYGFAMIWEYFSIIFVRSALSAFFFPRISLLYFLCFHFYVYSVPYGFFDCAFIPFFFMMLHAMLYSLLAFEIPAARRGATSLECPREVYSRISWPEWTASLPQEWTLFLPLNSRYIPLHDRNVILSPAVGNLSQESPV